MNEVTEDELGRSPSRRGLAEGGIDFFHVETMTDINEAVAAVEGIRRVSDLPIAVTLSFDSGNPEAGLRTMMGVTPAHLADKGRELELFAIGDNCGKGLEGYHAIEQHLRQRGRMQTSS
jgi:5-methyltetrahydrofolate--homocysteine methyltransferase